MPFTTPNTGVLLSWNTGNERNYGGNTIGFVLYDVGAYSISDVTVSFLDAFRLKQDFGSDRMNEEINQRIGADVLTKYGLTYGPFSMSS